MAKPIHAVQAYSPKIKRNETADLDELMGYITSHSGRQRSVVRGVLDELQAAMTDYFRSGIAVKLPHLGTFAPKINLQGKIKLAFWPAKEIITSVNEPGKYLGRNIENKEMIGKSEADLIARWNEEHPDDLISEKGKEKPDKPDKPDKPGKPKK